MNKSAITFRKTCKLFSKITRSGLGEIFEMHSVVFNDVDSNLPLRNRASIYNYYILPKLI